MKIKYGCRLLLLILLVNLTVGLSLATAQNEGRKEVLVLHSYSPDYEWTQTEQQGIEGILKPLENQIKVRIEYMDSNHSPSLLQGTLLKQLYKEKFAHSAFSAIIVTDNAALEFLRVNRDELFPGVPVIFCGVNGYDEAMIRGFNDVTGVAEDNDFLGLFEIALQLHPKTKRIMIYGIPDDPSHIANVALIRKLLPEFKRQVAVEIREFPDIEDCISDIQTLPEDSLVIAVGSMRTKGGEGVNLQRANEMISAAVSVPVYTGWDFGLNHGAIGGLVVSGKDQGRLAAEITLRILNGEAPADIEILQHVKNVYMFDYKQLLRYDLVDRKLPEGAVIFNSPDFSYRVSREAYWTGAVALVVLVATTIILSANIRQRQRAEAALMASEEKYSKAFRNCADVVGIAKLSDGNYVEVSDAFFETFGYDRDEVIDKPSSAYIQDDSSDHSFRLWLSATERNQLFKKLGQDGFLKNHETHWCTKSGEIRVGLYSAEVMTINGEDCIVYVWHDITERKWAEEELRRVNDDLEHKVEHRTQELSSLNQELIAMNEELQAINEELHHEVEVRRRIEEKLADANDELKHAFDELKAMQAHLVQSEKMAALGNLVAGVAHEINTPLGVGVTAASHLKQLTDQFKDFCQNGAPRRQDLIDYLHDLEEAVTITLKNLERAAKLVYSFKQVSVDQSSEVRREFNISSYLAEILLSMQPQLKRTKHTVSVECHEELKLDGYPGAFAQIVTNLVMNSLTHAFDPGDEGRISIKVERKNNELLFSYSDNGKGMQQNVLAKIFDPFFTTKRGIGGTGLGLYVVYNIVTQQFNGTIKCESQLGQGTTFHIYLPIGKEGTLDGKRG